MIKVNIVRHHTYFVDIVKTIYLDDEASARRWVNDILAGLELKTSTKYKAMLYECDTEDSPNQRFIGEMGGR